MLHSGLVFFFVFSFCLFLKPSFYCITYIFVLFLFFPLNFSFTPTILFIICVIKDIGRKKERQIDRKENWKKKNKTFELVFLHYYCLPCIFSHTGLVGGWLNDVTYHYTHIYIHTYIYMHSPIAS